LVAILPASLLADDTGAAILRSDGIGVLVNKYPARPNAAVFPHDLIETEKNAVARIETTGSSADINPETVVTFESDELVLDHGSLSVNTSRGLKVRVGCVTVTPVNNDAWTHYDVIDVDSKVTVSALKNDVYIDARSKNVTEAKQSAQSGRDVVHQGEQKSREEKCAGAEHQTRRLPGGALNSPWALAVGGGVVGVVACLGLCTEDDPLSPAKP
jgi:hypothetical protein